MKKIRPSVVNDFPSSSHFSSLALLIFVFLVISGTWQSSSKIARSQTSTEVRYTESLRLQEIEPGIEYGQITSGHASKDELTGPWFINVLRIDPQRARLKVVHALDEGVGMETVSSMAARFRAPAAVNGGYFRLTGPYRGESIGLLLLDGTLLSEPHNERAEFGLITNGTGTEIVFGHLRFTGEVSLGSAKNAVPGAKHAVHGLNRPLSPDELIVFTPAFHRTTLTNPDGIEVVVRNHRVSVINDLKGSSAIPVDGYVVSAVGRAREWLRRHVHKGAKLNFRWRLEPIEPDSDRAKWQRAYSILGAGPQLIKGGKIAITDKQEKMTAGFATDRHPRTAIAKLDSSKLLLVTVDGRQPGVSTGMTLEMLANLLLELGAVEAMNLDGGGSTTMVIHNRIVNKPSDQTGERPVSDAILVFPRLD